MSDSISYTQLEKVIDNYIPVVKDSLIKRWNNWKINLDEQIKFEVIGGILSRQVSLLIEFLGAVAIWNGNVGTIILRTMAENVIIIAWILKRDTIKRCEMFVDHGISQELLLLEKQKSEAQKRKLKEWEKEFLKHSEDLISRERNLYNLDVNIGAWANKNIRTMAEEAELKDFYDFSFTPFSFAAHSTWNHILQYNLKESDNPLHNFMKIPVVNEIQPDIHFAEIAIKYLDMCYKYVDLSFNGKSDNNSLVESFFEEFNKNE